MQSEKTLQWAVSQNNESVVVTLIGELTRNTLLAEMLNHYGKQTANHLIHTPKVIFTLAELYDLDEWLAQYTL